MSQMHEKAPCAHMACVACRKGHIKVRMPAALLALLTRLANQCEETSNPRDNTCEYMDNAVEEATRMHPPKLHSQEGCGVAEPPPIWNLSIHPGPLIFDTLSDLFPVSKSSSDGWNQKKKAKFGLLPRLSCHMQVPPSRTRLDSCLSKGDDPHIDIDADDSDGVVSKAFIWCQAANLGQLSETGPEGRTQMRELKIKHSTEFLLRLSCGISEPHRRGTSCLAASTVGMESSSESRPSATASAMAILDDGHRDHEEVATFVDWERKPGISMLTHKRVVSASSGIPAWACS
ncbi:hypothetical protein C8F01DRAFT_1231241, partial [Mycena amicta]